jgi:hypothetical protein
MTSDNPSCRKDLAVVAGVTTLSDFAFNQKQLDRPAEGFNGPTQPLICAFFSELAPCRGRGVGRNLSAYAGARQLADCRLARIFASRYAAAGLPPRHVRMVFANPLHVITDIARQARLLRRLRGSDCHENAPSALAIHALSDAQLGREQGWIPLWQSAAFWADNLPHTGRNDLHLHVHFRDVVLTGPNAHKRGLAHCF